ncbi:TPA: carbohydrate binding domain-containing protein [Klebsiella quasipneumoniae subsp. similipneumoniae]|nr:carbohydrate binding domain-containing protein [Klebsiella quasipneumoniae subsp. similipneumoniae]
MAEIKGIAGAKNNGGSKDNGQNRGTEIASVAYMKILLALSEGQIAGQFTGQDICLDGTPLLDADGHENFPGVTWEWRSGLVDQDYIQGFPAVENEISVSTEIKSGTPWVKAINNTQLSAVRLRIKFPNGVYSLRDSGGKDGYRIEFAIDVSTDGSTYTEYGRDTVDGIANTGYERSYRIDLPRATSGWQIRVRRLTENKNDNKTADVSRIESITEIVDAKLRYPNTALLFVQFDSTLFDGRTPTVTVKAKGLVIRVPSNYDPVERTYSGSWDGTFKWAWSNNPAWIFYDLVLNKRYGLGKRISSDQVDKWTLYQIGQYCDAPVSDGAGGKEARYLCDLYISQRTDAWTVLMDLANIFRGMISWSNNLLSVDADMPREMDPDFVFNKSNIVGSFTFSSTSERTNYSAAIVTYSNPQNNYQDDQASVYSQEVADRFGFNTIELSRIGCTRESEAQRHGAYAIETNRDDNGVEFKTGMEGRIPRVGKVIGINNAPMAGRQNGGRVAAVSGKTITLDRAVAAKAGDMLIINLPDGKSQGRKVQSAQDRIVTVEQEYNPAPQAEAGWVLDQSDLAIQQFRVKRVVNNNDGTVTINGLPYNPNKFPRVDDGAVIEDRPVTVIPPRGQEAPDDITISSLYRVSQGIGITTLVATWSPVKNAIAYEMQWRQNNGDWINLPRTGNTRFEVDGIYAGRYVVRVRAINAQDIVSVWGISKETELTGKSGAPLPPLALTTISLTAGIEIRWEFPVGAEDSQRTELQYSPDQHGEGALPLTDLAYPGKKYQQMGLKIATQFWYRARLIDRLGNASPWTGWVHGMSSENVDDYYQQLDDAIKDTDTYEELTGGIKEVSDSAQAAKDAAQAAQVTADGAVATNKQQQQQLNDQLADIQQNAKDITDAANAGAANAGAIAQEILDRQAGDLATANKAASDVADAIAKAETDDAEVAAQAAANLLATKNEVEAQISTTNTTMQDGFDSLAQQMASIAAGTGEQFDSLKIWYFEKDAEGWASDDSNINILPVDSDGWIYPAGASSTMRSPNPLAIDGQSYKYIRLRMKRVGNPAWAGRLYWIGVDEKGWESSRSVAIPAPDFDPATGISVVSIPDLLWANSGTIRRLRLDFSSNQDADNFFAVDWMAVGRPTPGASQAQIQDLKTAMTAADSAEAAARNTLAVQLRGNYEGTDPAKLVTGIIYNERQTRVTAEQAISSDVNTLRTDYNANKAAVTQRLDTLTSENQSQAQALTQLQSGLTDANGKIGANTTAINQLKTDVSNIDGRVTANSSLITGLESTINNDAIALVANPNNLLTNTGFERDKAAWTGFNSYSDIYAAQVPHSGAKILRGRAGGTTAISQVVASLKKGRTYRFGGYVKRSGDLVIGNAGNNKFRIGNADTGAGPLSELPFSQSNVGTNWTLLTKDYVSASDQNITFGINFLINTGELYFDDVFFVDVTDEINNAANASAISGLTTRVTAAEGKISTNSQSITQLKGDVSTLQGQIANKADASALQQLQTTVIQQGDKLASQGSAITELQNTAQNGKAKYWLTKIFDIKVSGSGYIPKLSDLSGVPPMALSEMADAAKLDFLTYGDYKIAYAKSLVYLNADKTIEISPGSRIVDDTGRLYVNGIETASFSASATKYALALKKGWNTLEFVVAQITGQFFINFGLKLSDNVDQLFSGAGQMAAASAAQVISSQVEQTAGKVDANSSAILTLNNSVKDINTALNNKADASALQSLTTRVSNAEGKITSQGNAITQLTNDLSTANGKITANTGAISSLTSRVTAAEGKIDSQAESITSINSSIKGILTQAANLIPNPTVDPAYPQMGMTVVSTTSEGVPAGCPYAWAIKCQYRDHVPVMNNIPCHEGQVFEISVLAACGTGTAPFQHYIGTSTQAAGSIGQPQANGGQISAATGAQWTRTTWRFKPNATHAAKGYFRPFLQINQAGPDFGTVWYATDWQVRDVTAAANAEGKADANATAISQLTTRVTNAEGQITSQGQAITKLTSDLSTLTGVVNSKADASALNALTTRVSNAEGKIASQGQSITQLTNSISNTESAMDAQGKIPGNLLANASFERGQVAFDGWSDLADVIDATNPHSGGKILRMNAGAGVKIGQSIEVTQGRRYRFGVFARQNAGTEIQDPANTKFRIADGSDNLLAGVNYGPFTNTWQHVSMDWTASKNTVAKFQLTAFLKTGVMYFDDVYVVDITNETNIKGNADAITSLNTKVTQQGNDITSQSNAITNLTNSLKTQQYSNSNPWVDGSFESYADGQTIGGANAAVTTEYAFSGSKSLKCRRADGETGNSDKQFGYETTIRENAVYRYECWAMMPEGETPPDGWGCNVGMIVRTAAGTAAWPTAFAINEAALTAGGGRGKWVKFSGKLAIDGKQKTRGRLWISTRGTAGGPGYRLYIDDLVITDVTDAHAAQTTADANSSAISGLTSRVSTAEGKITAQADSITKLTGEINTINGTLSQKADASAVNALQSRVTTAEGKIESQGTAITQLTNGLEAYRRTGENLVQNFDFLQGDTAYNVQNASKVTFGDYGDGKVGVRMVRTDGNSPGIFANNKKPIPQNGQRRYRYVVRAKGVSGAMNLLMRRWNFNGTVEGPGVDKNFTLTTSWQTLTWETDLTPATGVDGSAFGLYCHPSNAEIWIDSFKVYDITEEVTIKANSDALSTLTSTVTQNGKDIAAQANALTQLKSSLTNDAVALATNPNNMVANSGFERGTDNWSGFNAYADIYAAQSPRTGAYIMRGLSGGNVAVSQVILGIKKGRTYRYGGYMRRDSNTTIGNQGNNKFRIGNADTGAGPIHQVEYSQSNVGTSWTLITGDWVPASDQNIAFSINVLLTAGNFYFDDIFFVDVTDEINNAANATAITNLTTRVTSAEGKITSQGTAITQLTADLSTANGKITANANAITSLQSTVTQQGNILTTQGQAITKLNSDLSDLSGVVDTKASASAVSELTTRVTNAEGKITANSSALNSITSRVDDAEASIDGLNETTAANGMAMANGFQQLRAQIGDNQAAITQTNKVVADMEKTTAEQINTVQSSVNGMSATVQEVSSTVADINGKLGAQWGVKVATDTGGANPRVAGIQLGIDATGSSQFLVQADTFAVYTGGTGKVYPFIVQGGVAYMQEALIRDGSITNAKIGNEIRSNNFVDGSNGWRIAKDGSSQFNNVIVRGRVEANSGVFKGTVQADAFIGDIAVAKGYDSLTLRRNQTVQRNGAYQNRGYSMTVVLACTLVCETYGNGNNQLGYTIDVTFNIGGQQVTRRIYVDAGNIVLGTTAYELRFAARLDADNNKVSFFIKASGRDAVTDYTVSVENITATAFRTDSNSFS